MLVELKERTNQENARTLWFLVWFKVAMAVVIFVAMSVALIREPLVSWCAIAAIHLLTVVLVIAGCVRKERLKQHRAYIDAIAGGSAPIQVAGVFGRIRWRVLWWCLLLTITAVIMYAAVLRDSVLLLGWETLVVLVWVAVSIVNTRQRHDSNMGLAERVMNALAPKTSTAPADTPVGPAPSTTEPTTPPE